MSDEKIYIYHTNDIHSNLTYWPRIANELQEKRAIREENGDFVLAFDMGDASDRVHPLTEATDGQAISELLNEGQYDAVTIGNNEGITNSKEQLNHLYDNSNYSVILTNMLDTETNASPKWATPYEVYATNSGDRIGVLGMTIPLGETYDRLGWQVNNPVKELQHFFNAHKQEADFWILLSHLGLDQDRLLAKLFSIPLILGAHTHHALLEGELTAGTMLAGAGQFGNWIGEVIITKVHGKLQVESAKLLDVGYDISPVPNEQKQVAGYLERGHQLLNENKIAKIPMSLKHNWTKQTKLADVTLDAIADFAGTDAAIINAGLLMKDIESGVVTADHFHQTYPHPIRVMHCKIKGKHLIEFAHELNEIDDKMIHQPVQGFGFRGKVFGKLCFKGLSIDGPQVRWLDQAIEMEKDYEIATIDYFSFLPFFNKLNTYSTQQVLFPDFIRTVVSNYFAKNYPYKND